MAKTKNAKVSAPTEELADALKEAEKKVVKVAKNLTKKIGPEVKEAAGKVEAAIEYAEEKIEDIGEKVETAIELVEEKIEEGGEKMEKIAQKAVKKIEKSVEEVFVDSAEKTSHENKPVTKEKPKKKDEPMTLEEKKAKLSKLIKEKAEKLKSKVEEVKDIDLKKKVRPEREEEDKKETLVPMEDYLKSSIHLGTRVITPDARKYVYRRRADGLAVFNTALLDDKLREGAAYLAKFAPEDIIVVCKREAGWKAVSKFAEVTGIRAFTKKYPAGILTNTRLENFTEAELIFICDPWLDKNALADANRINIPVLSICDTNNFTTGVTQTIPGNNKSAKSIGMIFYLLTKLYIEARKLKIEAPLIQDFVEGWDTLVPPK